MLPLKIAILAGMPRHATRGATQGRGGGHGATWLPQLADAFFEFPDLSITWVTFDWKVTRLETDEDSNQRFLRIPIRSDFPSYLLAGWPVRLKLREVLRDIAPDVVHAWGTEWFYGTALKDVRCGSLLSVQGCLTAFSKVWKPSWRQRILESFEPSRIRSAKIVTCESPWSAEQVRAIHPDGDIRVVDYGVHPSFYQIPWNPDPADPILLYSGSLDERKGVDLLIEALAMTPDRPWRCQVFGDGPLRAQLEARAIPGVECLGVLPWNEMQQRMSKAWALVVPTRADTGPTVVKEARVIGLPVIGTVHGGLRDYIRPGVNGLLVDPLNAKNLSRVCMEMMSSFQNVRAMGETSHQEDCAFFRPERTASAFAALYRELAPRLAR